MSSYKVCCFLLCCIFSNFSFAEDYDFEDFLVSDVAVGPFKKGMTVHEVIKLLPEEQIKKVVNYEGFSEGEFDDYEIYDSSENHILTITPKGRDDLNNKISRVLILDDRFKTELQLGLGSSYEEIKKTYPSLKVSSNIEVIVLDLGEINAWMSIDKKQLPEDWWDVSRKRVDMRKIPPESIARSFVVWWD